MINITHILPKGSFSVLAKAKHQGKLVRAFIGSNIALAIIASTGSINTSLILPQHEIEASFNLPTETVSSTQKTIQVPIQFTYMSQGFHTFHPGIDLASKIGNPVKPVMKGTVIEAGASPFGYGNMILVDHGNGLVTLYAHLSKIISHKGDSVNMDTIIGLVGTTGHSTGPHLHLEVHQNGIAINPLSLITLNQQ